MLILPKLLALGFFFALNLFWSVSSIYADWSAFRGTPLHRGSANYAVGELSPIRWTSDNIGTVKSPPAVSTTGDVYVATTNGLTKINSSGEKIWVLSGAYSPSASPAIGDDGNIYTRLTQVCNFRLGIVENYRLVEN